MAKKAKAKVKKVAAKPAKLTVTQSIAVVMKDVEALRSKVATGSKTEIDRVQATLVEIAGKLGAIK